MTPVTVERAGEGLRVILGRDLDIAQAGALHAGLRDVLSEAHTVRVDAGGVTRVHTAALQVVYAFANACRQRGIAFELERASEEWAAALQLLGLSLPEVKHA